MELEPRHWYGLAFVLIIIAAVATMYVYDIGGVFSAPGLQQEGHP